jgi:hypothetical protein
VLLAGIAAGARNLARSCGPDQRQACPTSQSTTYNYQDASYANNGLQGGTHSHTHGAPGVCGSGTDGMFPWWMVDFGVAQRISGGTIWNRPDCCQDRLDGFQIWVGNSTTYNGPGNAKCFASSTYEHNIYPYTHSFNCLGLARYLFVVLTTGQCLAMQEIEIYFQGMHTRL